MARAAQPSVDPLLAVLAAKAPRPLSINELARALDWERFAPKRLRRLLEEQAERGKLRRIGKTRYQWIGDVDRAPARTAAPRRGARRASHVIGVYTRVRAGYGFVEVLGGEAAHFARDILISRGNEAEALHGDRVEVEILRRDARTHRVSGRIVKVLARAHERIIGTLEQDRRGWWVIPEDELLPPVQVVGERRPKPEDAGLVAVVRVTRGPTSEGLLPAGELEEVIGPGDDPRVQFLAIVFEHGLRTEFPPEVVAEAESLPADPTPEEIAAGRIDLRGLPFLTIDGENARDFDDAVCLEPGPGDGARAWVAIADVSHYVTPGSALDAEAACRGTSVYFPDRAIPMLPEALSSGLCSLNPGRDRLVLVAEMTCDGRGRRTGQRFYRGVIRSRARLTYTKVAAVLSETDTPEIRAWRNELGDLLGQLRALRGLMRLLFRNRVAAGSLDLDLPEALIDLSEEGKSIGVRLSQRNDAHRIIEELMLEANCAVAAHLRERSVPFPYRIHEPPAPAEVDDLNSFLRTFGFAVEYDSVVRPKDVQRLLDAVQGHRLGRVLSRLLLRSLKQARYSTENAGHFGLAFPVYCHFTSPIRRYPDLLVHRQLGHVLDDRIERALAAAEVMERASIESSQCERRAMEAERAMLDLKKAEFMLDHLLEPEPGTIVTVTNFGVFVELDAYPIEGLLRSEDLGEEAFAFIESERALRGLRTGQRFRIGDRVLVEANQVSLRRRQIDFTLLERLAPAIEEHPRASRKHAGSGRRRRQAGRRSARTGQTWR